MERSLFNHLAALIAAAVITAGNGWAADLADDKYTEWTTEKDLFVPMRDGIHLDTDVSLPKGATGKLPTVLVRTPYDKDIIENQTAFKWTDFFSQAGLCRRRAKRAREVFLRGELQERSSRCEH